MYFGFMIHLWSLVEKTQKKARTLEECQVIHEVNK